MIRTLVMNKDTGSGLIRYEIVSNKDNSFGGNKSGKANWLVHPNFSKSYKVDKLIPLYKELKTRGFKVSYIGI